MGDHDMYDTQTTSKPRHLGRWMVALGLAALFCCGGTATLMFRKAPEVKQGLVTVTRIPSEPAPTVTVTVTTKAAPPVVTKPASKPPKPKPTINGDTIVHVGEDVPPGTYRAQSDVAGMNCYWVKSTDAEAEDILSNDLPSGGRPQVTLKHGQWFTSDGCATWVRR